jgi:hypothetical protein
MRNKRPHISLELKLAVALRQLGLDPATAELDHIPALALRAVTARDPQGNPVAWDPPANDPGHLFWMSKAAHQLKTTGRRPGAAKTVTTAGSDSNVIKRLRRRIAAARIPEKLFHDALRGEIAGIKRKSRWLQGRKLRSRPFNKGPTNATHDSETTG